jgi:hypothetical protein
MQCDSPCKKGMGFLSIEDINAFTYIVYRSLTGQMLFSGALNTKFAKIKQIDA